MSQPPRPFFAFGVVMRTRVFRLRNSYFVEAAYGSRWLLGSQSWSCRCTAEAYERWTRAQVRACSRSGLSVYDFLCRWSFGGLSDRSIVCVCRERRSSF